jgi:bifunctional lysine-specific demethylase and histidyl-hydroxylase NO66
VFVFQTEGSKRWEVHSNEGVEEVVLEPGLCLYLPTGTPHAARAQDTVSLHVTLGINQLTWRGLVERTVQQVVERVPDDHLPGGFLEDRSELTEQLARRLEQVADDVRRLDATAAVEAEVRRFLTGRGSRLDGGLRDVLEAGDIDDTTLLRRRPGHPCVLIPRGERLEVLLGDRSLDVPAWLEPALEEIRARAELRPADLSLDPQSRLVLCRRLVREGLLGVAR